MIVANFPPVGSVNRLGELVLSLPQETRMLNGVGAGGEKTRLPDYHFYLYEMFRLMAVSLSFLSAVHMGIFANLADAKRCVSTKPIPELYR